MADTYLSALYLGGNCVFRRASSVAATEEGYVTGEMVYDYVSGLPGWAGGIVEGTVDFRGTVTLPTAVNINATGGRKVMSVTEQIDTSIGGMAAFRYTYQPVANTSIDYIVQSEVVTGDIFGGGGPSAKTGGMRMFPQSSAHRPAGYAPAWLDDKYQIVNMAMLKAFLELHYSRIITIAAYYDASPPAGSLYCNGQEFYDIDYPSLASKLKSVCSDCRGSASNKFKVPDLRGEFLRGWDNGRGYDSGRVAYSAQGHSFESHNHWINAQVLQMQGGGPLPGLQSGGYWGDQRFNVATSPTGYVGSGETRPTNRAVKYAIYY